MPLQFSNPQKAEIAIIIIMIILLIVLSGYFYGSASTNKGPVKEKQDKLENLKREIINMQNAVDKATADISTITEEIKLVQAQINEINENTSTLQLSNDTEKNTLISKISALQSQYNESVAKKSALVSKLQELTAKYNVDLADLQNTLSANNTQITNLTQNRANIDAQLGTCESTKSAGGNAELVAELAKLDASVKNPSAPSCDINELTRDCSAYNVQRTQDGQYAICPPNYSLWHRWWDNKPTCRYTIPENARQTTDPHYGKQCLDWDVSGRCDPRNYTLPCSTKWPNTKWQFPEGVITDQGSAVEDWYTFYTDPLPVNKVCNMK